jgi:hypothetical protein
VAFKIGIETPDLPEMLKPGRFRRLIDDLYSAGIDTFNAGTLRPALVEASTSVTGDLRSSWQTDPARVVGRIITGAVISSAVQALVIDEGAKKHFPPVGDPDGRPEPALATWLRRKPAVFRDQRTGRAFNWRDPGDLRRAAFLIGRKFKREGKPKLLIFSKTFTKLQPRARAAMRAVGKKVSAAVRKGRR